jgi:hypothetical protein
MTEQEKQHTRDRIGLRIYNLRKLKGMIHRNNNLPTAHTEEKEKAVKADDLQVV